VTAAELSSLEAFVISEPRFWPLASFWVKIFNSVGLASVQLALAVDLVSAPGSQTFVEKIFSVCGMLTAGRRNRMEKSLEMRIFLTLNSHLIDC
jgi:hypothetical protein